MSSKLTERELLNLLLRLLNHTTPHGTEQTLAPLLPQGGIWDEASNYIIEIGTDSQTMFCCHLDTVCSERMKTKVICHHGMIYSKKKRCPIGADDKAGVLVLIALIHANVPGLYIFHSGEECGGIGASHIAETIDLTRFKRAIEFDRRGTSSVITNMGWTETCSSGFANTLCDRLGMGFKPDPTGIFTDVLNYVEVIPEVTNLSVGYQNNHRDNERLDAAWLICRLIPALYRIDWESLPVERDPAETMRWRPGVMGLGHWLCDDWCDPTGFECETCGEKQPPGKLHEVEMGDGFLYTMCADCRSFYRGQGYAFGGNESVEQNERLMEIAM